MKTKKTEKKIWEERPGEQRKKSHDKNARFERNYKLKI